jgi:hypothetical protein
MRAESLLFQPGTAPQSKLTHFRAPCRPFASSEVGHNQLRRPLLLRVERRLLGIRLLCQFLDPIKQSLIGESGRQTLVMSDLFVELDTLLTHRLSAFQIKTAAAQISFNAGGS